MLVQLSGFLVASFFDKPTHFRALFAHPPSIPTVICGKYLGGRFGGFLRPLQKACTLPAKLVWVRTQERAKNAFASKI